MMRRIFSDRFRLLKMGSGAFVFVLLCQHARSQFGALHPDLSRVTVFGESLKGMTIHAQARLVVGHAPDGFDLETRAGPVRILSPERPRVGEFVSFTGRVAGERRIEAAGVQVNEGWAWKRAVNYAVSVATVLVFLWLIRGQFRTSLSEGLFRSRF